MLYWALTFLIIAIIAGILGFAGIAVVAAGIAKILFFIFLVLFVIALVSHTCWLHQEESSQAEDEIARNRLLAFAPTVFGDAQPRFRSLDRSCEARRTA